MKFQYGSWLTLLSATVVWAANSPACSSQPYKAALLLSSYAPAQSFCTKSFPLPRVTATSTASTITLTSTAEARTQTITGTVSTTTITSPSVTTVITESVASTSITTVSTGIIWITENEARRRRRRAVATTTNNAFALLWSSVSSRGSATLSTLCACIGTPVTTTTTITPKSTIGSTPTVYVTTTPISIVTVTPTSTSTITSVNIIVETQYITITSTTTLPAAPGPTSPYPPVRDCERLSAENDGVFAGFTLACNNDNSAGVDLFGFAADTFSDCLTLCVNYDGCKGVTFVGVVEGFDSNMCYGKQGTNLRQDARFDSAYLAE